jgi:CheY-like chemotaxis protein
MNQRHTTILLVDDIPENLRLLAEMLKKRGYSPRPVLSGPAALKLLERQPVDLILLDINMPGMDGYEVCARIKKDPKLKNIPIIFLSAAQDTSAKVLAFEAGGVDYITKPVQFEEMQARVQTHLRIRQMQISERQLLDRTLGGTVQLLVDCLQVASPRAFGRSARLKDYMDYIAKSLEVKERWMFRLAGSMAFIGCLALPDLLVERAFTRDDLDEIDKARFQRHAKIGQKMLSEIPRLEVVASIIGAQYEHSFLTAESPIHLRGGHCLRVARQVDQRVLEGQSVKSAVKHLMLEQPYDAPILGHFEKLTLHQSGSEVIEARIEDLVPKMVLVKPIKTVDGTLLLPQGQTLTEVAIQRIKTFVKNERIRQTFVVRRPAEDDWLG